MSDNHLLLNRLPRDRPLTLADVCALHADMYRSATQDVESMGDGMSVDEVLAERAKMKKEAKAKRLSLIHI